MTKPKGVILLEGPDGAGKTTLAEHLCEKYDGLYVHRTWSKTMDVWEHHTDGLKIAHENYKDRLVVIDRLYPSEMIYGKSLRSGGQYGDYNARSMERVLSRMAPVVGLVVPRNIEYVKDVHRRKWEQGLEHFDTVEDVAVRYVDWIDGSIIRPHDGDLIEQQSALGGYRQLRNDWLHYDVEKDGSRMDEVADEMIEKLQSRRDSQFEFALDPASPNIVGHKADAEFLIVGDTQSNPALLFPFFQNNYSTSFLNNALHAIKWNESLAVWTNVWDDNNLLPHIHSQAPHLKVVALGNEALKRCEQLRIDVHASVPHPSYEMRFNHHGGSNTAYSEQLREALK